MFLLSFYKKFVEVEAREGKKDRKGNKTQEWGILLGKKKRKRKEREKVTCESDLHAQHTGPLGVCEHPAFFFFLFFLFSFLSAKWPTKAQKRNSFVGVSLKANSN